MLIKLIIVWNANSFSFSILVVRSNESKLRASKKQAISLEIMMNKAQLLGKKREKERKDNAT